MINKILTLIFISILVISCSTNDKHVVVLAFSKQLHAVLYNDNSQATKTASKTYTQEDDITTVADSIIEKEEYTNTQAQIIEEVKEETKKEELTNNDALEEEKPQIIKQTEVIQQDDNEILITANIISFDFDSYELKNEYDEGINEICQYLNNNQDINLIIEGHSDSIGDFNYNILLSENRAKAIFDRLIYKGIDKERLRYIGYGSTHSSEYSDKDRKCQFVIINDSNEENEYKEENETDIIKLKQE
ncbi:peptidoglycan-associated lipoprotein [Brachyspira suanatina]|uniref:Peptidoglycan-associated lipoprotein n=1 Tax=Brachyspira suanatina TaxID=381802 RepID=A0A0G4K3G3_9SPIR|nr:OmpA family protein [Brachyspira suanatina]CRF31489.1 peptidoglycan-associated lipoprotein [Brachyspira suanatina]